MKPTTPTGSLLRRCAPVWLVLVCAAAAHAAPSPKADNPAQHVDQESLAQYTDMLMGVQAEITEALPAVPEQKKAAFQAAREAVEKTKADVNAAQQPLDKIEGAEALAGHAKGTRLGGAAKGIAAGEAALKKAAVTDADTQVAVGSNGVITIPAAASTRTCSIPTRRSRSTAMAPPADVNGGWLVVIRK